MNAAFESVFERSFSPSASVNLGFNDNIDIPKLMRDLFRLVEPRSDFASRRRHIESLQQFLGLIFVNVHLAELPGRSAISLPGSDQQRFSLQMCLPC
jgi:hypothetical protein